MYSVEKLLGITNLFHGVMKITHGVTILFHDVMKRTHDVTIITHGAAPKFSREFRSRAVR